MNSGIYRGMVLQKEEGPKLFYVRESTFNGLLRTINTLTNHREVTHQLRRDLDLYIRDMEKVTNLKISPMQKSKVKSHVANSRTLYLSPDERREKRMEFNGLRKQLINEWELHTGKTWPVYEENVIGADGKVQRLKGQFYDAHHIIELSYGGPTEWWNLHPAAFPHEHQGGIHRKDGIANRIFSGLGKHEH